MEMEIIMLTNLLASPMLPYIIDLAAVLFVAHLAIEYLDW